MRSPSAQEQYITVIDNKGRAKSQYVEYIVDDVRGEAIYVTVDGLQYVQDSLQAKAQDYLIVELDKLPNVLENPDIVIWDPVDSPGETLIYYKRLYIAGLRERKIVSAIVKVRQGIKFLYNFFLQEGGKVKGLPVVSPAENPNLVCCAKGETEPVWSIKTRTTTHAKASLSVSGAWIHRSNCA